MWGCLQIDRLFHQNIQLLRAVAVHLEVRQMRVEIESADAPQEIKSIRRRIDVNRGRGAVPHFRRSKAEIIGNGNTQITKQRPGKAAEALLPWKSGISMVMELHFLRRQYLTTGNAVDVANVMVGTNEQGMARIVQPLANRRQFTLTGMLLRALGIEADDDQYVDAIEKIAVEKHYLAVRGTALDDAYGIARADPHVLPEQRVIL